MVFLEKNLTRVSLYSADRFGSLRLLKVFLTVSSLISFVLRAFFQEVTLLLSIKLIFLSSILLKALLPDFDFW